MQVKQRGVRTTSWPFHCAINFFEGLVNATLIECQQAVWRLQGWKDRKENLLGPSLSMVVVTKARYYHITVKLLLSSSKAGRKNRRTIFMNSFIFHGILLGRLKPGGLSLCNGQQDLDGVRIGSLRIALARNSLFQIENCFRIPSSLRRTIFLKHTN